AGSFGEGLFGGVRVADLGFKGEIVSSVRPDFWGSGFERGDRTNDVRQLLPIDLDRFRRILCRVNAIGNDKSNGVADIAYNRCGEDRINGDFYVDIRQNARRR